MSWYQYKLLEPSECPDYVDYFDQHSNIIDVEWNFDMNHRKHTMIHIDIRHELYKKVETRLTNMHTEICEALEIPTVNKVRLFNVFINKYTQGDYCNWHFDRGQYKRFGNDEPEPTNPRLFNVSVNLNTGYTGGNLLIKNPKITPIPLRPIGMSTSFSTKFCHKVTEVTSDVRYSLITWVYADDDPAYYDGVPQDWVVKNEY